MLKVQRVTNTKIIDEVCLSRAGGPLGLSIIGGSDHSCVPFGTGEQVAIIHLFHSEQGIR